jgi:hypothetical protein
MFFLSVLVLNKLTANGMSSTVAQSLQRLYCLTCVKQYLPSSARMLVTCFSVITMAMESGPIAIWKKINITYQGYSANALPFY